MANTLPLPTCGRKTPVVVILNDSRISPYLRPENVMQWYIDPLLDHLKEANQPQSCHVALVGYGSAQCAGSPFAIYPFSQLDPGNKPVMLPTGHKISENPPGLTALDGYVAAIKMIEKFQRATKQDPNEDFSYYLWHIAAGQDDESAPSYFSFAQTCWNLTWDTIPAEIQSRNINLSVILLNPCPRYINLFSAVSPQSIRPWFITCPHHKILLSGFEHHLTPKLEDTALSTVLSKRLADNPVEHRARRLKTEDSSQSINTPSPPQLAPTSPTISQARVKATDSPIEPSPCEGQDTRNDQWSGTLSWSGQESDVCASIQVTDVVRDPQILAWPQHLRLEIAGTRMHALDFQAWIFKHRASVVRMQSTPGLGKQDFGELVKSLREGGRVAIVRFDSEIEGPPKRGLVLAPLYGALLCAAFLTSDMPELPNPPSEQQQQQKDPNADCTHAAEIPLVFENADYPQGDHCDNQPNVFIAESLTQSALPQQFPSQQSQVCVQGPMSQSPPRVQGPVPQPQACVQGPLAQPTAHIQGSQPQPQGCVQGPLLQQQVRVQGPLPQPHACIQGPPPQLAAYVQGPPPQPQAQQSSRRASLDAQHLLMGGLVPGNIELAASAESVDFLADSWDLSALYDRHINEVWVDCGSTPSNSWDNAGPAGDLSLAHF